MGATVQLAPGPVISGVCLPPAPNTKRHKVSGSGSPPGSVYRFVYRSHVPAAEGYPPPHPLCGALQAAIPASLNRTPDFVAAGCLATEVADCSGQEGLFGRGAKHACQGWARRRRAVEIRVVSPEWAAVSPSPVGPPRQSSWDGPAANC